MPKTLNAHDRPGLLLVSHDLTHEPEILERFLTDIEQAGLVNEQDNALTAFLCAASARRDDPLHLTVYGQSSSGKNYLLDRVAAFIPEDRKKFLTGMTPKVLMHSDEHEYEHKAIFIAEQEGVKGADYAIRTMQSEKVIEWEFVDTKRGVQKKAHRVRGPAAFLQATTRPVLHPENETRLLSIQIDESPEQTRAIIQRQARKAALGASVEPHQHLFAPWHSFIERLNVTSVCIPFADKIVPFFPDERVRSRRDFPKLLQLIETSAYLQQHQRERRPGENGGELIMASARDYEVAKRLFENSYRVGPDKAIEELLTAAKSIGGEFQVTDLMEKLRWGHTKTYEVLSRAKDILGCIGETDTRGRYRFLRHSPVPPLDLPDEIR